MINIYYLFLFFVVNLSMDSNEYFNDNQIFQEDLFQEDINKTNIINSTIIPINKFLNNDSPINFKSCIDFNENMNNTSITFLKFCRWYIFSIILGEFICYFFTLAKDNINLKNINESMKTNNTINIQDEKKNTNQNNKILKNQDNICKSYFNFDLLKVNIVRNLQLWLNAGEPVIFLISILSLSTSNILSPCNNLSPNFVPLVIQSAIAGHKIIETLLYGKNYEENNKDKVIYYLLSLVILILTFF